MTWSSLGALGNNQNKTAANNVQMGISTDALAGGVVVVGVAIDNISTTDGDLGDITSVTDSQSNVYTKARQRTNGQGAVAAGACAAIYFSKLTTALMTAG